MRVDKGFRGSVTVFAAMSFMLIVSVILVLIDGARLQGARAMVGMAAQMALDSMFSDMKRNCWIDMECCYLMVPMRVMNLMSSI